MSVNVELLDRTLAEVERAARRKRNRWIQSTWRVVDDPVCGTAMCFAGWACALAGDTFGDSFARSRGITALASASFTDVVLAREGDDESWTEPVLRTRVISVPDAAALRLGLDPEQADELFSGLNSLADLRRIVREIKASEASQQLVIADD